MNKAELAQKLYATAYVAREAVLDFAQHAEGLAEFRDAARFLREDFETAFTAFLDSPTVSALADLTAIWHGYVGDFASLSD